MDAEGWRRLPYGYMKASEPWGNVSKMNFYLIMLCDHLRKQLGTELWVTYGTQGWHKAPWHGRGLAVDACVDLSKVHPQDVILAVTKFNFTGFGVMPDAKHPMCNHAMGLHLDVRPVEALVQPQKRWIWYDKSEHPFTHSQLKHFGLT